MIKTITEEIAFGIIERVSERTGGIIEKCLVNELCHYIDHSTLLHFCEKNHIVIATEDKRMNFEISHSEEAVLILKIKKDDEQAKQTFILLTEMYKKTFNIWFTNGTIRIWIKMMPSRKL